MGHETLWVRVQALNWLDWAMIGLFLMIALSLIATVTGAVIEGFQELPPGRQRREELLRWVGLLGPGVMFFVWAPEGIFSPTEMSEYNGLKMFVVWLAWPAICYAVGHRDGKREVQRKLDAIYAEFAREKGGAQ